MKYREKQLSQCRILWHTLPVTTAVDHQDPQIGKVKFSGNLRNLTQNTQCCTTRAYPFPIRIGHHHKIGAAGQKASRLTLLQLSFKASRLLLVGSSKNNIVPAGEMFVCRGTLIIIPCILNRTGIKIGMSVRSFFTPYFSYRLCV